MNRLIFVYGSLKQGGSRNQLLQNSRYLGTAVTSNKYAIYRMGSYPAMVESAEEPTEVWGELYEVSDLTVQDLDVVEGVQSGLFNRRKIELSAVCLFRLPRDRNVFEELDKKTAESYFYQKEIGGAANSGKFWPI